MFQLFPISGEQMGETKNKNVHYNLDIIGAHMLALTIVGSTTGGEKPVFIDGHQHGLFPNRHP